MSRSIKDLADLQSLRKELKAQTEARQQKEVERQQRAEESQREAELFRRSIGDVAPLPNPNKVAFKAPALPPIPRQSIADERAALTESMSDEFTTETLLESDAALSFARNGIGSDVLRKLRRGHWVIQSELDLHGLRTDEAREALGEFLRDAAKGGWRCVRVIHGKGLGSINKKPVLKDKVRNWLAQKEEVIAFCQAKATDGGSGALVVLLKS